MTGQVLTKMADLACKIRKDIGKTDETKSSWVTGYGLTSPIGNTPEEFWNSLQTGKTGIGEITKFDHSEFAVHNAAEVQDFPFDKYCQKSYQPF